ncbi:hypothetical protein [Xanthobacter sp. KR7-225]|uniref:hypothetical protein n=1 Tax=Xanthobacter sp. KR7-225 TaxID=3156613 RepID=UPI0032B4AAEF
MNDKSEEPRTFARAPPRIPRKGIFAFSPSLVRQDPTSRVLQPHRSDAPLAKREDGRPDDALIALDLTVPRIWINATCVLAPVDARANFACQVGATPGLEHPVQKTE